MSLPPLVLIMALLVTLGLTSRAEAQLFIRGDIDSDSFVDVTDAAQLLGFLYDGQPPVPNPGDAGDVNDNGVLEVSDAVYLLQSFFAGGDDPPEPFPGFGLDTTPPNFPTAPTGFLAFELGSTTGCIGTPVEIPFRVTNSQTIEAINFNITYDQNEVTYVSYDDLPLLSLLGTVPDFLVALPDNGLVQFGMVFDFDGPLGSGLAPQIGSTVLNLTFELALTLPPGTNVEIALTDDPGDVPPNYNMASVLGQVVLAEKTNGTIAATCFPSDAEFTLDAPQAVIPGESGVATVLLSNVVDVEEFSFGLAFDTSAATFAGATAVGPLAATNGGAGPDFLTIDGNPANGTGITVSCDISTAGPATLPFGSNAPVLDLAFDVAPTAGPACSLITMEFVGTLGAPAVPVQITSGGGLTSPVSVFNGGIEIAPFEYPPASGGIALIAEAVAAQPGSPVDARVFIDTDTPVEAISFGLEFDPTDLTLDSVSQGPAVAQLACGAGPDYFFSTLFPAGLTVATIFDLTPPFDSAVLEPGADQEVCVLSFSTSATPLVNGSTLTFTDQLGSGVIPTAIEVTTGGTAVVPTTISGAVNFGTIAGSFSRGDCNDDGGVNIADAVFLLGFLFPGASGPSVITCDDACDGNDDGGLNIADGIAILGSLFGTTVTPLPPPASCGLDSTNDTLDCQAATSCP